MQGFTPELAAVVGILSSVFTAGVTYGIMRTKVERMERDLMEEKLERRANEEKFVTLPHFSAVVEPIQKQLVEIGRDIKKVLMNVSRREGKCED